MAKRSGNKGIFLKSVARMRRDAGPFGGGGMAVAMQAMCDRGREGSPEGWPCQCSLADEDGIVGIYERGYGEWKGGTRDMTPHVKGRGSKRGQTLRAHFFADYDDQLIVVCHFGEHMPSYQTSSI